MKILVTGSNGFIGKNVCAYFNEKKDIELLCYAHTDNISQLVQYIEAADFVIHLAGVNRPTLESEFKSGNTDFTAVLCSALQKNKRKLSVIFASSTQASEENVYGISKKETEDVLIDYSNRMGADVFIFRLPNVFGKWARPNYNSAVATFCHNIARNLPIKINDAEAGLKLVYIDDVIRQFEYIIYGGKTDGRFLSLPVAYHLTVGKLAEKLYQFHTDRNKMLIDKVGDGFERALYATYISYLLPADFSYRIPKHSDERGSFVEMLKTKNSGQFSFFTAEAGVTRGGHYHHTKSEKFLVVKGKAIFRFRNILTDEYFEIQTNSDHPEVVETVPGWVHDITNIGDDIMIVMLWANEIFDPLAPDTYTKSLA